MKYLFSLGVVAVVFISAFFTSCEKIKSYPATPTITYKSFWVRDTTIIGNKLRVGTITFDFVDGDGDFGLYQPGKDETDTTKLYNVYFTLYQKVNGTFEKDTSLRTKPYFPVYFYESMKREGQDKTLKGSIAVKMEYFIIKHDTIRYDFFIVDRALNKSNVESTPELILNPEPETK